MREVFGHALTHSSILSSQMVVSGDYREFSALWQCVEHHRVLGTMAPCRLFLLPGERMLLFASGSILPGLEYYVGAVCRSFLSYES